MKRPELMIEKLNGPFTTLTKWNGAKQFANVDDWINVCTKKGLCKCCTLFHFCYRLNVFYLCAIFYPCRNSLLVFVFIAIFFGISLCVWSIFVNKKNYYRNNYTNNCPFLACLFSTVHSVNHWNTSECSIVQVVLCLMHISKSSVLIQVSASLTMKLIFTVLYGSLYPLPLELIFKIFTQ